MFNKRSGPTFLVGDNNFIFRKKGVIPQEACDHMIEFFESRLDLQRPGTVGGNLKLKPEWKTDTEIGFGDENDDDPWIYTDFLYPCIDEYKTKHPYIDTID